MVLGFMKPGVRVKKHNQVPLARPGSKRSRSSVMASMDTCAAVGSGVRLLDACGEMSTPITCQRFGVRNKALRPSSMPRSTARPDCGR
jgi:hypothetical protein